MRAEGSKSISKITKLVCCCALLLSISPAIAAEADTTCINPGETNGSFSSAMGVVTKVILFGHGPNSAETLFELKGPTGVTRFAIWADTDPRLYPSFVTAVLNSQRENMPIEVCGCSITNYSHAKVLQINIGYTSKICIPS